MSIGNMILEGLHTNRAILESRFEDTPVSSKSREMQKVVSDVLNKRYLPIFKPLGCESVGVEIYSHDDDDTRVEDAIYEITVYIAFDTEIKIDVKAVQSLISKHMVNYPKFSYDRSSNQFYSTVEEYSDIIDIIGIFEKDGCRISKFYSIVDASDIEYEFDKQEKAWREEREDEIRAFNRSRF